MVLFNKAIYRFSQWALLLVLIVFIIGIYAYWHSIITQIVEWQRLFHDLLATHINAIAQDPIHHGLMLIVLSFVYGVFHAVGPGHGKAVIVTYLGSHKESLSRGAVISFLAALLQAGVAILLVVLLSQLLSIPFSEVNNYADDITLVSYILVMALGAFLFLTASFKYYRYIRQTVHEHTHEEKHEHHHEHHHQHAHHHDHACCGHHHVHQSDKQETWWQSIGVIFSMGIRPCTGAILVLIYAHLVGAFYYGVIATLVMGLGTGLAIASMALATQLARNWFEKLAQSSDQSLLFQLNLTHLSPWLRMAGGVVIFLLGLSLFQAGMQMDSAGHPLL